MWIPNITLVSFHHAYIHMYIYMCVFFQSMLTHYAREDIAPPSGIPFLFHSFKIFLIF